MSDQDAEGTSTPEMSQAADHTKYRLRVTAGPAYSTDTHKVVPVNAPQTVQIESEHMKVALAVRVQDYTGFPSSSPKTSPYFSDPAHTTDQYSISLSLIPKTSIPGNSVVFGNDFDRPIRDRLPPGFNQALKIAKWWIDPGLDGDAYADKPYLYSPALSTWNVLRIGEKQDTSSSSHPQIPNADSFHSETITEGSTPSDTSIRKELSIPTDAASRKKYFLTESNRQAFTFEAGRLYQSDFHNGYLVFNDFSLKIPGFTLNIIKYVDSKTHELRYTLKNKDTGDVYCVILFTLLFGDELAEVEKEEGGKSNVDDDGPEEEKAGGKGDIKKDEYGDEPPPGDDDLD